MKVVFVAYYISILDAKKLNDKHFLFASGTETARRIWGSGICLSIWSPRNPFTFVYRVEIDSKGASKIWLHTMCDTHLSAIEFRFIGLHTLCSALDTHIKTYIQSSKILYCSEGSIVETVQAFLLNSGEIQRSIHS